MLSFASVQQYRIVSFVTGEYKYTWVYNKSLSHSTEIFTLLRPGNESFDIYHEIAEFLILCLIYVIN